MEPTRVSPNTDIFLAAVEPQKKGKAEVATYNNAFTRAFALLFGSCEKVPYNGKDYYVKKSDFNTWKNAHHITSSKPQDFASQVKNYQARKEHVQGMDRTRDIGPRMKVAAYSETWVMKPEDLKEIASTLTKYGVMVDIALKNKMKEGHSLLSQEVKQLQDICKQFMTDVRSGKVKIDERIKSELDSIDLGGLGASAEPVTSKNFDKKFEGLHVGHNMGTPEKMKAFFAHEGSKELIEFAKGDKNAAKKLVKALVGEGEGEKGMHKQAANWYGRLSAEQKEDLAAIMKKAGIKAPKEK